MVQSRKNKTIDINTKQENHMTIEQIVAKIERTLEVRNQDKNKDRD
jgi:hypothetical protein